MRQVDEARWASEVHRTSQPRASSIDFAHRLMDAFDRSRGPARRPDPPVPAALGGKLGVHSRHPPIGKKGKAT